MPTYWKAVACEKNSILVPIAPKIIKNTATYTALGALASVSHSLELDLELLEVLREDPLTTTFEDVFLRDILCPFLIDAVLFTGFFIVYA